MRYLTLLFLAVPMLAAPPAIARAAKVPTVLEPTSPWHVHYADDYCRLSRSFGTGKQQITLIMDRFEPGDQFSMVLAGDSVKSSTVKETATVRFGPSLPEQKLDYMPGEIGTKTPAWIFANPLRIRPSSETESRQNNRDISTPEGEVAPITAEEEASVVDIQIGRPLRHPVTLKTGEMGHVFAAMRSCTDELLTHWGIDVTKYKHLSRPVRPVGDPQRWFRGDDYPAKMIEQSMPGLVQFRLTVGADGVPTACHIQQSTNPEGFDDTVCKYLMQRARFEPALDKDSKPMVSYYNDTIRFQIGN